MTQYASEEKNLTINLISCTQLCRSFGLSSQDGTKLTIFEKGQSNVIPKTVFLVSTKDYEDDWSEIEFSEDEVGGFGLRK